jgi:hypothetical protein
MPGAYEDSDLDSEIDKAPNEFELKPFIGPLDLSKKFQQSPASPTSLDESNSKRQHPKPKRFSEEHEKYYGKERGLDTLDLLILFKSLLMNQHQQTRLRSDSNKLDTAVKEELDALYKNNTWDVGLDLLTNG